MRCRLWRSDPSAPLINITVRNELPTSNKPRSAREQQHGKHAKCGENTGATNDGAREGELSDERYAVEQRVVSGKERSEFFGGHRPRSDRLE